MKKSTTFFILGLVITLLCSLVFILGGLYSCNTGGGILSGMKCIKTEHIGVCDYKGKEYIAPYSNENGSLHIDLNQAMLNLE